MWLEAAAVAWVCEGREEVGGGGRDTSSKEVSNSGTFVRMFT